MKAATCIEPVNPFQRQSAQACGWMGSHYTYDVPAPRAVVVAIASAAQSWYYDAPCRHDVTAGACSTTYGYVAVGMGEFAAESEDRIAANPINRTDSTGLKWDVQRKGGARANATPEAGDTIRTLATQIGLNPTEYQAWLKITFMWPYSALHLGLDDPIDTPEHPTCLLHFSVPNTVFIDVTAYGNGLLNANSRGIRAGAEDFFGHQGYKVVVTAWADSTAIRSHLNSPDIQGWEYIGHGNDAGNIDIRDQQNDSDQLSAGSLSVSLNHQLAFVILRACYLGKSHGVFQQFISDYGYIISWIPKIHCWTGFGDGSGQISRGRDAPTPF